MSSNYFLFKQSHHRRNHVLPMDLGRVCNTVRLPGWGGKIASAETPILSVDKFFEILDEGPTGTDIVVLNFHGKTLPNGNHLGWLAGELVEFAEEQIPEGVYIASCRGFSPDAPVYVAKRGSRDYGRGGFIAPPGKNLLGKMVWRYSDIRLLERIIHVAGAQHLLIIPARLPAQLPVQAQAARCVAGF